MKTKWMHQKKRPEMIKPVSKTSQERDEDSKINKGQPCLIKMGVRVQTFPAAWNNFLKKTGEYVQK